MSARVCILPVFVPHRGCPHACVFCNQRHISGETESASVDTVREMLHRAESAPLGRERQLAFYGGSFTAIAASEQEALLSAAKEGLDRGQIDAIRLSTRPDAIDPLVLERLRSFGVSTIELGAQSMDDAVLRLSGRGHTAEDVRRASRMIREAGFSLVLQMMTGLPGDSDERTAYTARELIALHPDGVRVYPTVVVRDTALYDLWRAGLYHEHTVEDAVRVCAGLLPLFAEAGVPIIRLGLNPTDELSGGEAVAGAYHPALGELVRSRVLRNRAEKLLSTVRPGSRVTLGASQRELSQVIGQRRANLDWLRDRFSLAELTVRPTGCAPGEIVLLKVITPVPEKGEFA